MHKEHYGFLFGILTALLLSLNAIFIRWADTVPIPVVIFIRFAISFLFLLPLIVRKQVHLHLGNIGKHLIRAVTGLIAMYAFYYSINLLSLVDAMTMFNTAPLFLPLIVLLWLKLIVPKIRLLAVFIGFLGILLILRPGSGVYPLGAILGLVGGFFSAVAQLGIRQLSKEESTQTILAYYFLISSIVSFFPAVCVWQPIESFTLWGILMLISLTSLAYQYCLAKSLAHAPATKVATMSYLNVVFSGLLGWWFFQEEPSLWAVFGSVLIVAGGLISIFSKQESRHWGERS